MDNHLIIEIEEYLNSKNIFSDSRMIYTETTGKYDSGLLDILDLKVKEMVPDKAEKTIYQEVISYIKGLNDAAYLRANGEVKEAAFYQYARIDKSTWSDMKWKQIKIKKKTLFKLALALNLDRVQTESLLQKGGEKFDLSDIQDKLVLAIIEVRKTHDLSVKDIESIIAEYQDMYKDTHPFDSIYDTAEMIAERKNNPGKSPKARRPGQ